MRVIYVWSFWLTTISNLADDGRSNNSNRNKIFHSTNTKKVEGMEPRAQSVSFQKMTYGGINGAYYTAMTSRRSGNDGVCDLFTPL